MTKFKKIFVILFSLVCIFGLSITVSADMGPKPYIDILIKGIEGEYVAAFAATSTGGPNFDYEDWKKSSERNPEYEPEYNPIMEYKDEEGFKWITFYKICDGEANISFSYYRPEVFKLIIYKEDKLYKVTEAIDTYAFGANYIIDFSDSIIKIERPYNYWPEILNFFIRVIITLVIEILAFILLRFNKKNLKIVIATNIFTQLMLNLSLNYIIHFNGYLSAMFLLFYMEVVVFVIESISYCIFIKDKNKINLIGYALIANILSFIIGLVLLNFGL